MVNVSRGNNPATTRRVKSRGSAATSRLIAGVGAVFLILLVIVWIVEESPPRSVGIGVRSSSPLTRVSRWPTRIEPTEYETITHPSMPRVSMKVPKFWSPPVHNNQLMSRKQAMEIGTCTQPDFWGRFNRGVSCPIDQRTMFVGIASFRDTECRQTIESIFQRAKYPDRVRVGVIDQLLESVDGNIWCDVPIRPCSENPDQAQCKYKSQIEVYRMNSTLAVGPVFARHLGHRMYRGEFYATQIDAHVTFVKDWDVDIVQQFEATKNEMAVLSTYLSDITESLDFKTGKSLVDTRPIMCNTDFERTGQGVYLRHGAQPERKPTIKGSPQLSPFWAAGYSFARGHFVVNVPYDQYEPLIFQGEEISIGIRGFTIGYDFYAPERSVCFHHYEKPKNVVKHYFWDEVSMDGIAGKRAMHRLMGIIGMDTQVQPSEWDHTEESVYGVGKVRSPDKFYRTFGVDVPNKKVHGKLCKFVDNDDGKDPSKLMHNMFSPYLRADGMGIDYSKITFELQDTAKA